MSHDRHDDDNGMTRREALLAAGAGGLSLMGICNACMAGEDKMIFGESTPPKNLSKLAPDNPIITALDNAAAKFQSGTLAGPRLSHDHVVGRIQEVFHTGEAARKLGRDRSVVRVAAASLEETRSRPDAIRQLASVGFSNSDLKNAAVFFTRSSLLDHNKITNVKSLPVSKLTEELPIQRNLNVNTIMAVNYDSKSSSLRMNTLLNGDRGALQISLLNLAVTPEMVKAVQASSVNLVDPPQINAQLISNVISRLRLGAKIVKAPSSSSGSSSGNSSSGNSSSGSSSNELSPVQKMQCFVDCLSQLSGTNIATMGGFCAGCAAAITAAVTADIASGGALTPLAIGLIIGGCVVCVALTATMFVTCFDLCNS